MNTELLLKVKAAILAEPLKFDMEMYFLENDESPCGTTACIGGHAIAISRNYKTLKPGLKIIFGRDDAQKALGLSNVQSDALFYEAMWPVSYFNKYVTAKTAKKRAQVAAERIDHFIATNGAE